ncbi:hypothetical protein QUS59_22960, partial [Xanthomonas citri pv. citri]
MVMGLRRQTAIDHLATPAIEELAAGHDRDEHRRASVLGGTHGRAWRRPSCRQEVAGGHIAILQARP